MELVGPLALASTAALPPWATAPARLSGDLLATIGLQSPYLSVDELVVIHLSAVDVTDAP